MYKVKVNGRDLHVEDAQSKTVNAKPFVADVVEVKKGRFHILSNNRSYTAEIIEANIEQKIFTIKMNNHTYHLSVKDKFDELLHEMGFDESQSKRSGDIKAPMPGLVLNVMVSQGQQIKAGDALVVLEAMKMENVLKAQSDGLVKRVIVKKGDKVEKNQVMIVF
jgi:acetyl/propionyl-CoA carboxylase alpha subunit